MRKTALIAVACASLGAGKAAASDFVLALTDTGLREYYCQIMVTLENHTDTPLTEISGFFYAYIGDEQVGRSKGSWFMNVPAEGTATATFETPNAPCDEVERYEFVLGACRIGQGFEDKAACAARITGEAPLAAPSS